MPEETTATTVEPFVDYTTQLNDIKDSIYITNYMILALVVITLSTAIIGAIFRFTRGMFD